MFRTLLTVLSLILVFLSLGIRLLSCSERDLNLGPYRFLFLRDGLIGYGHLIDHDEVDESHKAILTNFYGTATQIDPQDSREFLVDIERVLATEGGAR